MSESSSKTMEAEVSICLQSIQTKSSKYTRHSQQLVRVGQAVKFLPFAFLVFQLHSYLCSFILEIVSNICAAFLISVSHLVGLFKSLQPPTCRTFQGELLIQRVSRRGKFPTLPILSSCGWTNNKINTQQMNRRKRKLNKFNSCAQRSHRNKS